MIQFLVVVVIFVSITWLIDSTIKRKALNAERMKLIERGGDLKDLEFKAQNDFFSRNNSLKYGSVAVGVSIGAIIGSFLEQNEILSNATIGYVSAISLFVGLALILSYYLSGKKPE